MGSYILLFMVRIKLPIKQVLKHRQDPINKVGSLKETEKAGLLAHHHRQYFEKILQSNKCFIRYDVLAYFLFFKKNFIVCM